MVASPPRPRLTDQEMEPPRPAPGQPRRRPAGRTPVPLVDDRHQRRQVADGTAQTEQVFPHEPRGAGRVAVGEGGGLMVEGQPPGVVGVRDVDDAIGGPAGRHRPAARHEEDLDPLAGEAIGRGQPGRGDCVGVGPGVGGDPLHDGPGVDATGPDGAAIEEGGGPCAGRPPMPFSSPSRTGRVCRPAGLALSSTLAAAPGGARWRAPGGPSTPTVRGPPRPAMGASSVGAPAAGSGGSTMTMWFTARSAAAPSVMGRGGPSASPPAPVVGRGSGLGSLGDRAAGRPAVASARRSRRAAGRSRGWQGRPEGDAPRVDRPEAIDRP